MSRGAPSAPLAPRAPDAPRGGPDAQKAPATRTYIPYRGAARGHILLPVPSLSADARPAGRSPWQTALRRTGLASAWLLASFAWLAVIAAVVLDLSGGGTWDQALADLDSWLPDSFVGRVAHAGVAAVGFAARLLAGAR